MTIAVIPLFPVFFILLKLSLRSWRFCLRGVKSLGGEAARGMGRKSLKNKQPTATQANSNFTPIYLRRESFPLKMYRLGIARNKRSGANHRFVAVVLQISFVLGSSSEHPNFKGPQGLKMSHVAALVRSQVIGLLPF